MKVEFCSCARGCQWCGIFHYHWWTASIKPSLLFPLCRLCFLGTFLILIMSYNLKDKSSFEIQSVEPEQWPCCPFKLLTHNFISGILFCCDDTCLPWDIKTFTFVNFWCMVEIYFTNDRKIITSSEAMGETWISVIKSLYYAEKLNTCSVLFRSKHPKSRYSAVNNNAMVPSSLKLLHILINFSLYLRMHETILYQHA